MSLTSISTREVYAGSFHSPRWAGWAASVTVNGQSRAVQGIYQTEEAARNAAERELARLQEATEAGR